MGNKRNQRPRPQCPVCGGYNTKYKIRRKNGKYKIYCKDCKVYRDVKLTADNTKVININKKAKKYQAQKPDNYKNQYNTCIKLLKIGPQSIENISNKTGLLPYQVRNIIEELKQDKYNIYSNNNDSYELSYHTVPGGVKRLNPDYWKGDWIRFGLIGDTHLCSKFERLDVLNCLYDIFADEGIPIVLHAGNMVDGECNLNKFEVHTVGLTAQVDYLLKEYPQRDGILTKFITADEHEGWYAKRERINMGEYIEMKAKLAGRDDLEYIGHIEADIRFKGIESGESWIRIMHPGGGTAYAFSYTPQKIVESFQGGDKPRILILGHFHKLEWCYPREVHSYQIGCTQDQTGWMRKKKIQAMLGGMILEFKLAKDGTINRVRHETITFFDKKFYIGKKKYWVE